MYMRFSWQNMAEDFRGVSFFLLRSVPFFVTKSYLQFALTERTANGMFPRSHEE